MYMNGKSSSLKSLNYLIFCTLSIHLLATRIKEFDISWKQPFEISATLYQQNGMSFVF